MSGDLEQGSINKESRPPSPPQDLDAKQEDGRRLLYKIDLRVVPILSLCYLFASLDRANIGHVIYSPIKLGHFCFPFFLSFVYSNIVC